MFKSDLIEQFYLDALKIRLKTQNNIHVQIYTEWRALIKQYSFKGRNILRLILIDGHIHAVFLEIIQKWVAIAFFQDVFFNFSA